MRTQVRLYQDDVTRMFVDWLKKYMPILKAEKSTIRICARPAGTSESWVDLDVDVLIEISE